MNGWWSKTLAIAGREFIVNITTKSFLFGVALTPLLIVAVMFLPSMFKGKEKRVTRRVAVVDQTRKVYPLLARLARHASVADRTLEIRLEDGGADARIKKDLEVRVDRQELDAFVILAPDLLEKGEGASYHARNLYRFALPRALNRLLDQAVTSLRLEAFKIDPALLARAMKRVRLEDVQIGEKEKASGSRPKKRSRASFILPFVFVFLLFMGIMVIGQNLLTSLMEEKSSRIIEILLSSVTPMQLMLGKVMGTCGVGLTLVLVWGGGAYGAATLKEVTHLVSLENIGWFALFFISGFLLYGTLMVGLGSVCNNWKEAQNLMSPISILLIVPLMLWFEISKNPDGTLAFVLSVIPFFAPFVMMNRLVSYPPPAVWEVLLASGLLILSVPLAIWLSARVFRVGILMYGKPPRLREIWRWLRAAS